jgi:hypothetical protein
MTNRWLGLGVCASLFSFACAGGDGAEEEARGGLATASPWQVEDVRATSTVDPQEARYRESRALAIARKKVEHVRLVDALGLGADARAGVLDALALELDARMKLADYRRQHPGAGVAELSRRARQGDTELAKLLRDANPQQLRMKLRNTLGEAGYERYAAARESRLGRLARSGEPSERARAVLAAKGVVR